MYSKDNEICLFNNNTAAAGSEFIRTRKCSESNNQIFGEMNKIFQEKLNYFCVLFFQFSVRYIFQAHTETANIWNAECSTI